MKEPTIAEIEKNPNIYAIWLLLQWDETIRQAKVEIQYLKEQRNKLAKKYKNAIRP